MPGPIDWPDRLVPPPRAVIGTPRSAAICTAVARSSSVFGDHDAERLDLVVAGVGGIEPARRVVEADLAGQMLAQMANQGVPALGGEVVHRGIVREVWDLGNTASVGRVRWLATNSEPGVRPRPSPELPNHPTHLVSCAVSRRPPGPVLPDAPSARNLPQARGSTVPIVPDSRMIGIVRIGAEYRGDTRWPCMRGHRIRVARSGE